MCQSLQLPKPDTPQKELKRKRIIKQRKNAMQNIEHLEKAVEETLGLSEEDFNNDEDEDASNSNHNNYNNGNESNANNYVILQHFTKEEKVVEKFCVAEPGAPFGPSPRLATENYFF